MPTDSAGGLGGSAPHRSGGLAQAPNKGCAFSIGMAEQCRWAPNQGVTSAQEQGMARPYGVVLGVGARLDSQDREEAVVLQWWGKAGSSGRGGNMDSSADGESRKPGKGGKLGQTLGHSRVGRQEDQEGRKNGVLQEPGKTRMREIKGIMGACRCWGRQEAIEDRKCRGVGVLGKTRRLGTGETGGMLPVGEDRNGRNEGNTVARGCMGKEEGSETREVSQCGKVLLH